MIIEFIVAECERKAETWRIIGRCGRSDIRLGDTFRWTIHQESLLRPEPVSVEQAAADGEVVELRVYAAEYYGGTHDWVPSGWTARITVTGSGGELVQKDDLLVGTKPEA